MESSLRLIISDFLSVAVLLSVFGFVFAVLLGLGFTVVLQLQTAPFILVFSVL